MSAFLFPIDIKKFFVLIGYITNKETEWQRQ